MLQRVWLVRNDWIGQSAAPEREKSGASMERSAGDGGAIAAMGIESTGVAEQHKGMKKVEHKNR